MALINLGLIAIYKFVNYAMANLFWDIFILPVILNPIFHLFLWLIRFLSLLWFSELANAAIAYRNFKPPNTVSISYTISAFANIFVVQMSYVCTAELLLWLNAWPPLCYTIYFLMNAELNSLYCFDYIWIARELGVTQKLTMIERRWAYHLGFGFLLTLPISLCSPIVSGSIFGILFPFFIISSVLTDATGPEMCASKESGCRASKIPLIPIFCTTQLISKRFSRFFTSGLSRLLGGELRKVDD